MKQLLLTTSFILIGMVTFAQVGLHIEQGSANTTLHTGGYGWIGNSLGIHLSLDNNEIQARNVSTPSTLFLNYYGGTMDLLGFQNDDGDLSVDGTGMYYDNSTNRLGIGLSNPAGKLSVDAGGSGDAIVITNAGDDGLFINEGNYGIYSYNQDITGIFVEDAGLYGLYISNSGQDGVYVSGAGGHAGRFTNDVSSTDAAMHTGHGDDNKYDLSLSGQGRIIVDDGLAIQLDKDDDSGTRNFTIYNSASQGGNNIFNVNETGRVTISGNLFVSGTVSKGGGSFKIDHPLDPENKYLYHSFVESPDMMNVYNGNVVLDLSGEAIVVMDDYFGALNRDFRYQLTAIGAPGPNLYIAEKLNDNTFKIAGGTEGSEVSWQVTGIRKDPYANAHRIPTEIEKEPFNKDRYLHPKAWAVERGVASLPAVLSDQVTDDPIKTIGMKNAELSKAAPIKIKTKLTQTASSIKKPPANIQE